MKSVKVFILTLGMMGFGSGAFGQNMPDSIAVCPPGEPAEMIVISPEDVVSEDAATQSDGSRLMTMEEIAVATDTIMSNYDTEWTDLSMQGKLSFDGLPMSVSVKIYMKRGESVILSARASIFGEVARVEVNQDSVTFINKHTRCYNTQSLQGIGVDKKAYLTDLQDILLGEVAFPGRGRLTGELAAMSHWISLPTSETLIYPSPEVQTPGSEYGFIMDSENWQLKSFLLMLQKTGIVIETKYMYGDKGWTLGLEISEPKKKMKGEVELSYPDYNPTPLQFTELGSKYRKVDFKQLMKF